jgi:hypothetical protein
LCIRQCPCIYSSVSPSKLRLPAALLCTPLCTVTLGRACCNDTSPKRPSNTASAAVPISMDVKDLMDEEGSEGAKGVEGAEGAAVRWQQGPDGPLV